MPWFMMRASGGLIWFNRKPHGIDLQEVEGGATEEAATRGPASSGGETDTEAEG